MANNHTDDELLTQINDLPAIDCHTHLDASHLSARGLHDIMLYHMVISELYSAGCPAAVRLSDEPDEKEICSRIEEAIPYLEYIQNTSCYWLMRSILKDLYEFNEPITLHNWRDIDTRIRERSSTKEWARKIFKKAHIVKASTEYALRGNGNNDDMLYYSMEWAFFMRNQWKYADAPLYELEYAWQFKEPVRPLPLLWTNPPSTNRRIKTVQEVNEAMKSYCRTIPFERVTSTANYVSGSINYMVVTDAQMQQALNNRDHAGAGERDIYASYLFEAYLNELENADKKLVFQFSTAAEPLPYETYSGLKQETIDQIGRLIARHPQLQFQGFIASRHGNQSFCTLCRELPNLSLAGYWWHNFFPGVIAQVIDERLDMLPISRQLGFFSDAYCVDWLYAKSKLVRAELAKALTMRIARGQYTVDMAMEVAKKLFVNTPELYC